MKLRTAVDVQPDWKPIITLPLWAFELICKHAEWLMEDPKSSGQLKRLVPLLEALVEGPPKKKTRDTTSRIR